MWCYWIFLDPTSLIPDQKYSDWRVARACPAWANALFVCVVTRDILILAFALDQRSGKHLSVSRQT